MIPCSLPKAQLDSHREAIDGALCRVLDGGSYILGGETATFEREFATYCGVEHAIGVNSGTDAIQIALRALGIGPGDEVVTVSHTAVATVAAIEASGAVPVLVDIDPHYYTMDPQRFESAVTPRTKGVIPVHLYGQPADLDAILLIARRHGIKVIEDCAQAVGATWQGRRVGGFGDVGCFSFYPTKNLGALGDGGMVVTGDAELAERLKRIREYGWDSHRTSFYTGLNSRLDEIQSAVLRTKLPHLDADNARRRTLADSYDDKLAGLLELPKRRADAEHVFHLYVVRTADRDGLVEYLHANGIGAAVHYPRAIHQQPAYRDRLACPGGMARTEQAVDEILTLPMYPELSADIVTMIAETIQAFRLQ